MSHGKWDGRNTAYKGKKWKLEIETDKTFYYIKKNFGSIKENMVTLTKTWSQ